MSNTSINYDGRTGWFGKWRDISGIEEAYETEVRKILVIVGALMALTCAITASLQPNETLSLDDLGLSIPTGIAGAILLPRGIFFNYGRHLRNCDPQGVQFRGVDPLEAEAVQFIKTATFDDLTTHFCHVASYYEPGFYRFLNLEPFVRKGFITPEQGNFVRSILDPWVAGKKALNNLTSQLCAVPTDIASHPCYSVNANEKIRNQNEANAAERTRLGELIREKETFLKDIERRWNSERPMTFPASEMAGGVKHSARDS